jgi:hypothetical protein
MNCNRLVLRNIETIDRRHRDEARGWGRTRKERERRNDDKHDCKHHDERLVVDEHGEVHNIEDYHGNIEEGLARFAAYVGRQPCESGNLAEEPPPVRAVPDFARWAAAEAEAEAEKTKDQGGTSNKPVTAETGFGVGNNGASRGDGATLVLTESGERAKIQNELGDEERHGTELALYEADAMFENELDRDGEVEASDDQEVRGLSGSAAGGSVVPPQADKDDIGDDEEGRAEPGVATSAPTPCKREREERDGGAGEPAQTERLSKRERKRRRRERMLTAMVHRREALLELNEDKEPIESVLADVKRLLPEAARLIKSQLSRS